MSALFRMHSFVFACLVVLTFNATAWERGPVERFATLPLGAPAPEGITVDRHGDVYVTGFDPFGEAPGKLFVFNEDGQLNRVVSVVGSSPALLGLAFHPTTHELLVIDFGAGNVLGVNPNSGASRVFSSIPGGGLNALTFDSRGNVYISDSGRGIVWRTGPSGGSASKWVEHALLLPGDGFPPFGANGLDFNKHETALFVANTAKDTVVRIPVTAGSPGTPEVFVHSINGVDGLFVDKEDNIWVAANQADEVVVIDQTGKAIAKLGDFGGVDGGSPRGLLFPASLARHRDFIYITNLSLDLRLFGGQTVDSQWAAKVKQHTVSRISARIPRTESDE